MCAHEQEMKYFKDFMNKYTVIIIIVNNKVTFFVRNSEQK